MKIGFVPPLLLVFGPLLLGASAVAAEADSNAGFLSRLFGTVCLANLGRPEATRQWALDHNLTPITEPRAREVFVGPEPAKPAAPSAEAPAPGVRAGAWFVQGPGPEWFVVSLRNGIGACAVWAQEADPKAVIDAFLQGVKDPEKPDVEVRDIGERLSTTRFGQMRIAFYVIGAARRGFLFTVVTTEHPGGAFQASLQVAPLGP